MHVRIARALCVLVLAGGLVVGPARAQTPEWQAVFNPFQLLSLHLELSDADWDTIRFDTTNEIEVPAQFWADGEAPILVSVRRKSSRALPSEADPRKIGLKVDINELVDGQLWHGLNKLSLENGGDNDPITEGLAWNLHEMASVDGFYGAGYHPALAAWVRVYVNGNYLGVYTSVEQRDKQFLRNRGLFVNNQTWLYEIDDISSVALEEGDPHSPTYNALCYSPFRTGNRRSGVCATPNDAALEAELEAYIDMQAMLTQGAVDAYTANGDALFSHGKNYFFADFLGGRKRMYYPWDLDAVFGGSNANIYAKESGGNRPKLTQSAFQSVILNHPTYRARYNAIMLGLVDGPISVANIHAFLDQAELAVGQALAEDPYAQVGDVGAHFDGLRQWVAARDANVRVQVANNNRPSPR